MRVVQIALLAAVAVLAAAVVGAAPWPAPADDTAPAPAKDTAEAKRLAKGKELIDGICFWCHEPELMQTQRLNKKDWGDLIRPMIYEGAPVTAAEFEMIVEYLSKNFGPEGEPNGPQAQEDRK